MPDMPSGVPMTEEEKHGMIIYAGIFICTLIGIAVWLAAMES